MIEEVDENGDGEIDFNEFCGLMVNQLKQAEPEEELVEVFKMFDKDGDGRITVGDLEEIFKELGEKISREEIEEMIEEHDADNDKCF